MVDSRFDPGAQLESVLLAFIIVEQNLVGISIVTLVVFHRRLGIHVTHRIAIV